MRNRKTRRGRIRGGAGKFGWPGDLRSDVSNRVASGCVYVSPIFAISHTAIWETTTKSVMGTDDVMKANAKSENGWSMLQ